MTSDKAQVDLQDLLINDKNRATIQPAARDVIYLTREDAEKEHSILIARLHYLRRKLGYPPLPTGKETRRAASGAKRK